MGIGSTLARQGRKIKKLAKPPSKGQRNIERATREQRAYAKGQVKMGAATAGLAGLGIAELRSRLKEAETAKERAEIKAAIEEALREIAVEEKDMAKTPAKSKRPKARPREMNKGGYANCGASMKPAQKSTKMAYGGMTKKK